MSDAKPTSSAAPKAISGIDVMRGVGAQQAKGFWADAWERVLQRKGAVFGIAWISVVAFFAIFAPIIASAHPVYLERLDASGAVTEVEWPLVSNLSPTDWLLMLGFAVGLPWVLFGPKSLGRSGRLGVLVVALLQAGLTIVLAGSIAKWADGSSVEWLKQAARLESGPWPIVGCVAAVVGLVAMVVPTFDTRAPRIATVVATALIAATLVLMSGGQKLINFERYIDDENAGKIRAVWAPIPWSPQYTRSDMSAIKPGTAVAETPRLAEYAGTKFGERRNWLGTDALGGDVLAQMMWACRLSISIGLVSTGISLLIGVTIGAIMGYFGGWIDLFLFRIVEIFMAVPVLFLLIVAAGVLPRDTYVMMAIIGCFSWTGAARFTRAEFLKLRKQDFVQAAQATGLPLRAILFRHMLPNGVTPVLVDASFAIAAAISVEATLSFLGLGPDGQASWGKLLSSATASTGTFVWWLAVFPGLAIFLSVLSYNLLGEALRDAIDPKLRKAAH